MTSCDVHSLMPTQIGLTKPAVLITIIHYDLNCINIFKRFVMRRWYLCLDLY